MPTTATTITISKDHSELLHTAFSLYARNLLVLWANEDMLTQRHADLALNHLIELNNECNYPRMLECWFRSDFKNKVVTVLREDGSTIQVSPFDYWSMSISFKQIEDEST